MHAKFSFMSISFCFSVEDIISVLLFAYIICTSVPEPLFFFLEYNLHKVNATMLTVTHVHTAIETPTPTPDMRVILVHELYL